VAKQPASYGEAHAMKCLEIWGGAHAAREAISTPGIDAWVLSQPHERGDVGGDVHYVSTCGAGNISRFVLADVSGHGPSVGDVSGLLHRLTRKFINTPDQTRFARALNTGLSGDDSRGLFATALLMTYRASDDLLIVVNAGHPRPAIYRAAEQRWAWLDSSAPGLADEARGLPLGVIEPMEYEQFAARLEPGDLIVAYTDAVTEAGARRGKMIGEDGLLDLLESLDPSEAHLAGDRLLERVREADGGEIEDDITLLVLHHNAADPPAQSLGEKVEVMGKMLGLIRP
jgi:serine phosphatase RsbU (regulator of sigma subunit)